MFIFFICVREIYALDMEITGKEAEARLGAEFTRSSHFNGDLSAAGAVELNGRLVFKTGLSAGRALDITDIKLFFNTRYRLTEKRPLGVGLSWMYNGLPEYETHSNTILPVVYYDGKYWGAAFGFCFRFTGFFNESAVFESTLSGNIYANFINSERIRIGVSLANFNDFQARNFAFYSLNFNSAIRINRRLSILNELELMQSGGDGLTTAFYGIAVREGAKFAW